MGSFSREFAIRQVTPIIHFQPDESGAALRATELKPKLDRFLCGRYREEQGETVPLAWQIAGAPGSDGRSDYYHLNYKAQVFPKGRTAKIEIERNNFPMYFGNMGDGEEKHGLFCPEGLTLKVTCLISDKAQREALLTFIGDNLELFFLTHNFGTRQTKGYGGFLYCPEKPLTEQLETIRRKYSQFIYFQLGSAIRYDRTPVFESAKNPPEWAAKTDLVSVAMKTGRNLRSQRDVEDNYVKGYLMTYGENGSDKAMMKGAFGVGLTKDGRMPERRRPKPGNYSFKRAVLGLTDTYTFYQVNGHKGKATITVKHNERDEKKQIVRFPSPVLVKVLPTAVCFLPEDAGLILNKEFAFQCRDRKQIISTPAAFDTAQFLEEFAGWYNNRGYAKNSGDKFEPGSLRDRCSKIQLIPEGACQNPVGGEQT